MLLLFTGICHGALQKQRLGFDKDYLAVHVLPFLIPKSTQPTLNVSQVCICNWYCCWVCCIVFHVYLYILHLIGNIYSCWLITLFVHVAVIEALFSIMCVAVNTSLHWMALFDYTVGMNILMYIPFSFTNS